MDKFETYAISKGYELVEFDRDDNVKNGIIFVKGVEKQTKYLNYYDKFYLNGNTIIYQTTSSSEVLNIKKQSISLGFKLSRTYFNDKTQVKNYNNKKYELSIYTIPRNEEYNWVTYEISISKL